eukprot:GHVS01024401.1.p1 GENE.GHVS01024401.1~~GHVS01024401.1.p1  ORF type:complete len:249 (-),score=28.89 GHVS01024401.1:899-1645(-)
MAAAALAVGGNAYTHVHEHARIHPHAHTLMHVHIYKQAYVCTYTHPHIFLLLCSVCYLVSDNKHNNDTRNTKTTPSTTATNTTSITTTSTTYKPDLMSIPPTSSPPKRMDIHATEMHVGDENDSPAFVVVFHRAGGTEVSHVVVLLRPSYARLLYVFSCAATERRRCCRWCAFTRSTGCTSCGTQGTVQMSTTIALPSPYRFVYQCMYTDSIIACAESARIHCVGGRVGLRHVVACVGGRDFQQSSSQ